ncbi:ImmA/IrrE family metallo-endopeptidase [uncultured Treponema sp.]|uniref:ImmA/IrrE family metallo-endopeptidase n=1 Tax=uncultured Treponema sp. TaxID=162155 RepID=UPI00262183E3|nr:ImmA/IrrE family metallo-endopeptidase [uncultured Treponema sp.]
MATYKPDFKKSYIAAHEKLVKLPLGTTFPLKTAKIIEDFSDLELHSFNWAEKHGFLRIYFKSESAELYEQNGCYTIFYNETKPSTHSKFSILHELFHYESNHDLNAGEKNTELYNKQEVEANFFAAEMLMPEPVIKELEKRGKKMDAKEIQKVFGTSAKAAEIRFKTLKSYPNFLRSNEEKEFDEYLVKFTFKKFIDSICPKMRKLDLQNEYELQAERDRWIAEGY